jgi:hypothetical protein
LYHVLVDGGGALNLISLAAFKKLQILMSKLVPSCLLSRVGPGSVMPRCNIFLLVTFGMPNNYCTESILFDVMEVNLPINAILSRPILYQFIVIAHYGYLVLKMPSPNGAIRIRGDRTACVSALEKLQTPAAAHEAATSPTSSSPRGPTIDFLRQSGSHCQPSNNTSQGVIAVNTISTVCATSKKFFCGVYRVLVLLRTLLHHKM